MVAATGNNAEVAWENALHARSGIAPITRFDCSKLPVTFAGCVNHLESGEAMDLKEWGRASLFTKLAAVAAHEAVIRSGLDTANPQPKWGTSIGVGLGGLEDIEENTRILDAKGARRISPFFIPYTIANMAAGVVSRRYGLQGPNICTTTACASGTHGIGEAFLYLKLGLADVMVAGGAESAVSPLGLASFASMKALSTDNENPVTASKPFDLHRDGFVMGEGAGILVLEELEHAKKRGATIYGEMVGYGMSGDAYHITAPSPGGEGARRCIRAALEFGQIQKERVGYINAHGTSTKLNDALESQAIMEVFGDHAPSISISSTKGVTGHCLGAAGGIEAVYSLLTLYTGKIPPTANWCERDPECPLDYVPDIGREKELDCVLSNSFGFGGTNSTIIFAKYSH